MVKEIIKKLCLIENNLLYLVYEKRMHNLTVSNIYTPSVHYVETRRVRNIKEAKN